MGWLDWFKGKKGKDQGPAEPVAATPSPPVDDALARRIEGVADGLKAPQRAHYGDQIPFLYGAGVLWEDGGPDPMSSVRIYWNDDGPHWHYVAYGMSELGEKLSTDADVSGWGFELTFRLRARPEDRGTEPEKFLGSIAYNAPKWPIGTLNELGRVVWKNRRPFRRDDFVFAVGFPDGPRPGIFQLDRDLGEATTPNGRVSFLDVRAISPDDLERLKAQDRNPEEYDRAIAAIASGLPVANAG